jgi:hypothetical protein
LTTKKASIHPVLEAGLNQVEKRVTRLAVVERLTAAGQQAGQPGLQDEQERNDEQRPDHGPPSRVPGTGRLLGHGGDAVEAEEAEHGDGQCGGQQRRADQLRVPQRRGTPADVGQGGAADGAHGDDDEDHHEHQLDGQEHPVRDLEGVDSQQVDHGVHQHEDDGPHPALGAGNSPIIDSAAKT